ncbi:MAG: glycosyl transferase family 2 [Verrucomicrobia bacterium]|nr:MAG: glycosyl transferase family 2 [Verrucomicrobiota bacterium]
MTPLVSILIPAYNAEPWIADTIRSALRQTWPRTEIIIVDDGSRDRTFEIAQQFSSDYVFVVTQENQGAAAARNRAFELCQGDYIQWLDADDLLWPDKIAKQMEASDRCGSTRMLFSSAWAYFYYRWDRANFTPTSLWCDLSPVEWLVHKMGQNLHMPNSTWLVSRELTQAAGCWDRRLSLDDDGEYFCRVILASDAIRFVPEAKVLYRISGCDSLSNVGESRRKLQSQFLSMRFHVGYLRSLEDSDRVRAACLKYLQRRFMRFYPEEVALVNQLQQLAATVGGRLDIPPLSWKYLWMQKLFGWTVTKRTRQHYNRWKSSAARSWDKALFYLGRQTLGARSGSCNRKSPFNTLIPFNEHSKSS